MCFLSPRAHLLRALASLLQTSIKRTRDGERAHPGRHLAAHLWLCCGSARLCCVSRTCQRVDCVLAPPPAQRHRKSIITRRPFQHHSLSVTTAAAALGRPISIPDPQSIDQSNDGADPTPRAHAKQARVDRDAAAGARVTSQKVRECLGKWIRCVADDERKPDEPSHVSCRVCISNIDRSTYPFVHPSVDQCSPID